MIRILQVVLALALVISVSAGAVAEDESSSKATLAVQMPETDTAKGEAAEVGIAAPDENSEEESKLRPIEELTKEELCSRILDMMGLGQELWGYLPELRASSDEESGKITMVEYNMNETWTDIKELDKETLIKIYGRVSTERVRIINDRTLRQLQRERVRTMNERRMKQLRDEERRRRQERQLRQLRGN